MISVFQRFVAWRYLLQRPRKLSVPIMVIAALALIGAAAAYLYASKGMEPFDPRRQDVRLGAVGCAAVAELALLLLVVRYYFTFFTTVSIAGVCIGSMALVIVLSVMSGFETDLRNKILGSNAHILVSKEGAPFIEYREVEARISGLDGVAAAMPYAVSEVVIAANRNYANVVIKGVVPERVSAVTSLGKNLREPGGVEKLWPLSESGEVLGPPPAESDGGGPVNEAANPAVPTSADNADSQPLDPVPDDFGVGTGEPVDYSGGVTDPAPSDLEAPGGEPHDLGAPPDRPTPGAARGDVGYDDDAGPVQGGAVTITPLGEDFYDDAEFEEGMLAELPPPPIPARVATLPGILVGKELVKTIHLYVGQEVRLISPLTDPINPGGAPLPYTRNYRVAGTFFTGMYEYDLKFVYVELESLQRFLNLGDEVDGIEIRINDPDETESIAANLKRMLGPDYLVQDWKELNRNLFSALKLEKIAMFLVLAIIILVASFSIIGNLIMTVVEKAREIAQLKTLGASDTGVMQIFITQGFFIGLVGTLLGVGQGLLACWLGSTFGLPLNPDVYYIDRLPIAVEAGSVAAVAVAGIAISVLATLYPAYVAARLRPAEGLRYE